MIEQKNYPLNGVKTHELLGQLIRAYGWDVLAEQIPLRCFKSYPSFDSSLKYLLQTEWARQRLEAFYLYKFKQLPRPSSEQHQLPPRDRTFTPEQLALTGTPAEIVLGDAEFFDDPISGAVFPSRKAVQATQSAAKHKKRLANEAAENQAEVTPLEPPKQDSSAASAPKPFTKPMPEKTSSATKEQSVDPWSKWRKP